MREPKTIIAVLAPDHVVKDGKRFAELCAKATAGEIVTFGVKPDHPATGFGYIHPGEPLSVDPQVRRVERFVEKPSEERAQGFIESGYLWNSGNFVFRADVMLEELARFEPEVAARRRARRLRWRARISASSFSTANSSSTRRRSHNSRTNFRPR
jgi:mannose-1-phosphate guanylyltransferase / mannose-6-phosphate isomerase